MGILRKLGLVAAAVLAAVVVGLGAGFLYGRTAPDRAARSLLAAHVTEEPVQSTLAPVENEPAPTSGAPAGRVRCGHAFAPVTVDDQVSSLNAGVVLVQFRESMLGSTVAAELAETDHTVVLMAPNPGLDSPVVATAWGRRLNLSEADGALLRAFVTAYGGRRVASAPCTPEQPR